MNDFLEFVLHLLERGLSLAILAVAVCAAGLVAAFVIFRIITKGKKRFPWSKAILILMLVGYFAVLAYATLLRYGGDGIRQSNLHLFRVWREAWNSFFFQDWLNIFINIGMFLPLGIILPFLSNLFKKWYVTIPLGAVLSLVIEVIQYFTCRGIMDIDDLFANFLGTALGYCLVMIFLGEKNKFLYSVVPLLFTVSMLCIFGAYHFKEYGNLQDAPYFTANTKGITWNIDFELNDETQTVPTYYKKPFTKKSCDEFGEDFAERLGIVFEDKYYYNSMTIFANHFGGGFLNVYYNDGRYSYTGGGAIGEENVVYSREVVVSVLSSFGIFIPDEAEFYVDEYKNHIFTVDMVLIDGKLYDGEISCKCLANERIANLENNLLIFDAYKNEKIMSEAEAYDLLKAGKFSGNDIIERFSPSEITVDSCTLDYRADTKGFYRPVYIFEISFDDIYNVDAMIPAM